MEYNKINDQTLLRMMARGDENALGELYDRYNRLVFSIAHNSLNDPALAEEVTQDVFLRVWKNANTYKPEHGKVSTWMVGITRNRAIDEFRHQSVRPQSNQVPWEIGDSDIEENGLSVEAKVDQSLRQNQVRMAVAQLPEDQRLALAYAYFQGYSHREIASLLNEPLGTIKTRIRLAMKKIKEYLEDELSNGTSR